MPWRRLTTVGLICAASSAFGLAVLPQSPPVVRKGHPRIFFNAESWPAAKAAAEGPAKADKVRLLRRCDAYPDDPKCSGTEPAPDGFSSSTPLPPVREWGRGAADCALAWRLTGDDRYLVKAKKMLTSSVAAYCQAYTNRRAVSWESTSRILAFAAYDWICEALTEDERRAIIVPSVQHVEDVQPGPGKPAIVRRNGGPGGYRAGFYGVDSLLWYSGLAALGDGFCDDLARRHLETGYDNCRKMLEYRAESSGDDGPLSSGTCGYAIGAYPWAHFNFFHSLKSATGLDAATAYPGLALFPNFVWWNWIQNERAPLQFGSGDTRHGLNLLGVGYLSEHLAQYMRFFKDVDHDAARLSVTLRGMLPPCNLAQTWPMYPFLLADVEDVQPFSAAELAARSPRARHFESTGQFFMRSGWTPDSTYCLFIAGGPDSGHRHYDENGFVIYKRGFLALDSGSRAYQDDMNLAHYFSQTVAHNCMLIHKPGEPLPPHWGVRSADRSEWLCDGGQTVKAAAKVLAFETNPMYTYIVSDAAAAYPGKSTECLRQFLFLADDCFVVYDRVSATQAKFGKEWLLHSENEPVIDGSVAEVRAGKGVLFCRTMLPQGAVVEKIGGPGREFWSNGRNWPINPKFVAEREAAAEKFGMGPWFGAWRLAVRPPSEAKKDRFLHVINVSSDEDGARAVESERVSDGREDGCVIRIPKAKVKGRVGTLVAEVRFARDGEAAGRISCKLLGKDGKTIASGTRRFATGVQAQAGVFCRKGQ